MRKILVALLCLLSIAPAIADDEDHGMGVFVETRMLSKGPQELVVYYDHYVTDKLGFYAQTVKESDGYASAYAGPKFKIAEGIEAGIGIGREVLERGAHSTVVKNAWLYIDQDKYTIYGTVERGAGGTWHKVTAVYKLSDALSIGGMNETGLGTGPRAELNFAKDWQAWAAVFPSTKQVAVAVNYSF